VDINVSSEAADLFSPATIPPGPFVSVNLKSIDSLDFFAFSRCWLRLAVFDEAFSKDKEYCNCQCCDRELPLAEAISTKVGT
jgi:hypothetical protein